MLKTTVIQKIFNLDNLQFIDLTHAINEQTPHWQGRCSFKHITVSDYEDNPDKITFKTNEISMRAGIGTHMDAPAHCIRNGTTVANIPLQQLIRACVMIDVSEQADEHFLIQPDSVFVHEKEWGEIPSDAFVVFYTGWERFFHEPDKYRNELVFPSIAASTAELLLRRNIAGLGIDTLSPDLPNTNFPVHRLLLGAGKYLVENIANAKKLSPRGDYIFVLPMKIQHGTEAPVRAFAMQTL